ncbi:MAG TPA: sensor histidine kinase [Actinomycetes bacterium]|nr:sensor histidine kinase [Actinomycetes bacterium]
MPEDVPLAGSAGSVTPGPPAGSAGEVTPGPLPGTAEPATPGPLTLRRTNGYFALVTLTVTVLAVGSSDESAGHRLGVIATVAAMALVYVVAGPAAITEDLTWPRLLAMHLVLLGLFAIAVALSGACSFLLFVLIPLAYMTLPLAAATVAAVVLNLVPAAVLYAGSGQFDRETKAALAFAAPGIVFSIGFGTWVTRIVQESQRRRELIEELQATRAEVARLSREAGTEAERQRLSAEIHDTLAQGFSSIVMLVQAADAELARDPAKAREHLQLAAATARENLAEARALVAGLGPTALTDSSLPEALTRLARRAGTDTGIATSVLVSGPARALPTAVDVAFLRAAQESLSNVRQHAGATKVSICLDYRPDRVALTVTDDGRGLPPEAEQLGYGLQGLRARAAQVGGTLTLGAGEPGGAMVRMEIPS